MFIFNTIIGIMGIIILLVTFSCGPYRGGLRARSGPRTGSWRPLLLNLQTYTLYAVYKTQHLTPGYSWRTFWDHHRSLPPHITVVSTQKSIRTHINSIHATYRAASLTSVPTDSDYCVTRGVGGVMCVAAWTVLKSCGPAAGLVSADSPPGRWNSNLTVMRKSTLTALGPFALRPSMPVIDSSVSSSQL